MKASQINAILRKAYTQPEWVIFFEVADGTGGASRRRADAVAMNMWPSRGLELRAFEVKVSRSDLKSELKDPSKAEAIAQYCNTFYLTTPTGLTKDMDIPQNWGLIEISERGQMRIQRKAHYNPEPIDLSRQFIASLLRSAYQTTEGEIRLQLEQERRALLSNHEKSVETEVTRRLQRSRNNATQNQELIDRLEEILGETHRTILNDQEFLMAVRAVRSLGTKTSWEGVSLIQSYLQHGVEAMNQLRQKLEEASQSISKGAS